MNENDFKKVPYNELVSKGLTDQNHNRLANLAVISKLEDVIWAARLWVSRVKSRELSTQLDPLLSVVVLTVLTPCKEVQEPVTQGVQVQQSQFDAEEWLCWMQNWSIYTAFSQKYTFILIGAGFRDDGKGINHWTDGYIKYKGFSEGAAVTICALNQAFLIRFNLYGKGERRRELCHKLTLEQV